MTIDFHVHGKITNSLPFDSERFLSTVNEAKKMKIDSLALTEHLHSKNFLEGYVFLTENYPLENDYYNVDGLRVFYGMEITTKQKYDVLIIGKPENIINLRIGIINESEDERTVDIHNLFESLNPRDLLIILAHPFRETAELGGLNNDIISKLDAIELNAGDLYDHGVGSMKDKIAELSIKLNIPAVCGSDTHFFTGMGSVKNIFYDTCNGVKDIKTQIKSGKYITEISSDLEDRVKNARLNKKMTKICHP